jgi:hypothetical protein
MPRVLDPSSQIIFCEGRPDSLDDLFLNHLVPGGRGFIQPVGGKQAMRAFIEGYLGTYPGASPRYLGFRDRDFDFEPPSDPQLIRLPGEKPIWTSHRAAIENYLIDADLIWKYWSERKSAPAWRHGPPLSKDEIESYIEQSARDLADYQAVRWALASLKPGPRWPEIRTTWLDSSGKLPSSLAYDDCLDQARQLVTTFQDQIRNITVDHLKASSERYRAQFTGEAFFQEGAYLIWFHGKDHLACLCRRLAPNFPRRHYESWAAEQVDVSRHFDLQQLRDLIG